MHMDERLTGSGAVVRVVTEPVVIPVQQPSHAMVGDRGGW